jgi:hypothetical protein
MAAGADGVRVGTRFIASAESDAHPRWIDAVVRARATDAVVSTAFNAGLPESGPHRVLRGSIEAADALADEQVGVIRLAGAEIPVPRFSAQPPHASRRASSPRCRSMPASWPARCAGFSRRRRSLPSWPPASRNGHSADRWSSPDLSRALLTAHHPPGGDILDELLRAALNRNHG